jgi:hypothetical protein
MKTLITPLGSYLTGDAIADAVLDYWRALAREGRADVIDVPIVSTDGEPARVTITIGWMTPLAAVDTLYRPEFLDGKAVKSMTNLTQSVTPGGHGQVDADELPETAPDGWYLLSRHA